MSKKIDLIGKRFGRLVVLEEGVPRMSGKQRKLTWRCRCDCGNEGEYLGNLLKTGHTTSCGCARQGIGAKDLAGQRFGRLTAIEPVGKKDRCILWRCECDCGNEVDVKSNNLRSGNSTSCGCKIRDVQFKGGDKFHNLTVVEYLGVKEINERKQRVWKCLCDCGNETEATSSQLKSGGKKTCGRNCEINAEKQRKPKSKVPVREYEDLTGQKFGQLTVLKRVDGGSGGIIWLCSCDCGNEKEVASTNLRSGSTKTCGCSGHIFKDLTGKKFGRLTVIERAEDTETPSGAKVQWLCKCECGNTNKVTTQQLNNGHTKSCGCLKKDKPNNYLGHFNGISYSFFNRIKRAAEKRNIDFEIGIEDVYNQYEEQGFVCALTGQDIEFSEKRPDNKKYVQTASVDRIDSTKGYTVDNIQIVHKQINKIKHALSQEDFISMCKQVAEYDNPSPDINPKPNPKTRNYSYPL